MDKRHPSPSFPPARWTWGLWALATGFYLVAFYNRVAPAVITSELMREFAIGAAALGNLSAVYFYTYVVMQIPAGVLLDRFGPRCVLSAGALITAAGTWLFAEATDVYWANAGRGVIGAAVGVSFVGVIALSSRWFPRDRVSFATGMALLVGILGAIFGGAPLRWLVDRFEWRPVMLASAVLTLLLCAAMWTLIRDRPSMRGFRDYEGSPARTDGSILAALRDVGRVPSVWAVFVAQGGLTNITLTFAGLWGVPFLVAHYHMSTADAAWIASIMMIAMAAGGPLLALLAARIGSARTVCVGVSALGLTAWLPIVFVPDLPRPVLIALLMSTGFCSGALVVGIELARSLVPARLAGTATGIANMGAVLGPTVMQPMAGVVLDFMWDGVMVAGARNYSFGAYQAAFALMALWTALAASLFLITRRPKAV